MTQKEILRNIEKKQCSLLKKYLESNEITIKIMDLISELTDLSFQIVFDIDHQAIVINFIESRSVFLNDLLEIAKENEVITCEVLEKYAEF